MHFHPSIHLALRISAFIQPLVIISAIKEPIFKFFNYRVHFIKNFEPAYLSAVALANVEAGVFEVAHRVHPEPVEG